MSARSRLEECTRPCLNLLRGDRARAAPNALELTRLAREYDLNLLRAFGMFLEGWATSAIGAPGRGLEGMRRGVELLREQNILCVRRAVEDCAGRGRSAGRRSRPRGRDPRRSAVDVRPHRLSRI